MQLLGGNLLTSVSQGLQFFMLARALGPSEFGRVAAATSVMQLLMPFAGAGAPNVMIMRSARDPSVLPTYLGNAFAVLIVSALMLVGLATFGVTPLLNGQVPLMVMAVLGVSELLATRALDVCWQVFVAREELRYTSLFLTAQSLSRLLAAAAFVLVTDAPHATQWVWWSLVSNLIVTGWATVVTVRQVGRVQLDLPLARKELGVGVAFALGQSARGFYTDADKMFLARYTSAEIVGQYTMAFRVVQIALTVVRAVSTALQARFFRAGERGLAGTIELTMRVLRPTVVGALLLALVFYVCAPLLTWIAGDKYQASVELLRMMALMPLVTAASVVLLDALWTSNLQRIGAFSQIATALIMCGLCLFMIPKWGARGAALASYTSQIVLCVLCAGAVYNGRRALLAAEALRASGEGRPST